MADHICYMRFFEVKEVHERERAKTNFMNDKITLHAQFSSVCLFKRTKKDELSLNI